MKHQIILLLLSAVSINACNVGELPNKDLSKKNIEFVELSFPKGVNQSKTMKLDSSHLDVFAKILKARNETFSKPKSCYSLYIKLKNGGAVQYMTDGVNFQGLDDSSDLPFSFTTQTNILITVFNLQTIDSCK
ncbi:MAG: hypothetical protein V4556_07430 [Bacteroidota bacterium]